MSKDACTVTQLQLPFSTVVPSVAALVRWVGLVVFNGGCLAAFSGGCLVAFGGGRLVVLGGGCSVAFDGGCLVERRVCGMREGREGLRQMWILPVLRYSLGPGTENSGTKKLFSDDFLN